MSTTNFIKEIYPRRFPFRRDSEWCLLWKGATAAFLSSRASSSCSKGLEDMAHDGNCNCQAFYLFLFAHPVKPVKLSGIVSGSKLVPVLDWTTYERGGQQKEGSGGGEGKPLVISAKTYIGRFLAPCGFSQYSAKTTKKKHWMCKKNFFRNTWNFSSRIYVSMFSKSHNLHMYVCKFF